MFVDDNGITAYCEDMPQALHQSVVAAYELYGFPGEDGCSPALLPTRGNDTFLTSCGT
jgi:hypothetical protein